MGQYNWSDWWVVAGEIDLFAVTELHQIAPVAARVKFLMPLWDIAQRIERGMQESKVTVNDNIRQGDFYDWDRAIHGASSTPAYQLLKEESVHTFQYSLRLDPKVHPW